MTGNMQPNNAGKGRYGAKSMGTRDSRRQRESLEKCQLLSFFHSSQICSVYKYQGIVKCHLTTEYLQDVCL